MASSSASLSCLSKIEFKRCLESQYGLLGHLVENGCLTKQVVNDLNERHKTQLERNNDLIGHINESNLNEFEQGLEKTNQRHLANFIRRNGKRGPPDEEWPLSRSVVKSIEKCGRNFAEAIHTASLADHLLAAGCISKEHRDSIVSKDTTTYNKNNELLNIMERRSIQQLEKFKLCLTQSEHPPYLLDMLAKEIANMNLAEDSDDVSALEVEHRANADWCKSFSTTHPGVEVIKHDRVLKGVTVIGHETFVVRENQTQVNVYDSRNVKLSRNINVFDLKSPACIAGCSHNIALYISDKKLKCIHKGDLVNDSVTRWEMKKNHEPRGLSVTAEHTLLVTVRISDTEGESGASGVLEYTSEGQQVREIRFDRSIKKAWQTVQLSSDQFIVSHGLGFSSRHRVCVINAEGQIIKSFGRGEGTGEDRLFEPESLAIDEKSKHVFVADRMNNRVLMFDSKLSRLGEVRVPRKFKYPCRLYFDSSTDRLFVAESGSGSLFVISPQRQ